MEYRKLGRTGLKVSPLCLGTMNFGWENTGLGEPDSYRVMDHALDVGINFFDTANAGPKSGSIRRTNSRPIIASSRCER